MFRVVAILATAGAALLAVALLRGNLGAIGTSPMRDRDRRWHSFIWLVMLIGTALGALTGIGSLIIWGGPIGGWTLILHCLAAPLFAIAIALIALLWAGAYMRGPCAGSCSFWLMLISGMVAIFSIAFTMTPLFGTANQHFLLSVHRWSSLALVFFMVLHAARVLAARRVAP
ncbi:MAG TPA: hypothetical protein VGP94_07220 [Tepidisphaeraceae bacterium]|nr:hypothetical protein [Tepidisphaeraceae bacterium]